MLSWQVYSGLKAQRAALLQQENNKYIVSTSIMMLFSDNMLKVDS